MEGTTPCLNKLPLPFLHLGSAPTGAGEGQLALVSQRSSDPASVGVAGRHTTSSTMSLICPGIFDGLKLGSRMAAGGGALLLQPCRMKTAAPEFGEHREDPRPTLHKVSVLPPSADHFIGSLSSIDCQGVSLDLGMLVDPLFLRNYGAAGNQWWTKVGHGGRDSKTQILVFWGFFLQSFMAPIALVVSFDFFVVSVVILCF